jgi:hypothetical protein
MLSSQLNVELNILYSSIYITKKKLLSEEVLEQVKIKTELELRESQN